MAPHFGRVQDVRPLQIYDAMMGWVKKTTGGFVFAVKPVLNMEKTFFCNMNNVFCLDVLRDIESIYPVSVLCSTLVVPSCGNHATSLVPSLLER